MAPGGAALPRFPADKIWISTKTVDQNRISAVSRTLLEADAIGAAVDQLAEQDPAGPIVASQLLLFDREKVGRTGVDLDAWKQHRQGQVLDVRRLFHHVRSTEIVPRVFQDMDQGLRDG